MLFCHRSSLRTSASTHQDEVRSMAITRIYADGEEQSRFGSFLIRMTGSGEHWYSIGCVCVRERDRHTHTQYLKFLFITFMATGLVYSSIRLHKFLFFFFSRVLLSNRRTVLLSNNASEQFLC